MAVQVVKGFRSARSKAVSFGSFRMVYLLYLNCENRTVSLHVMLSRSDGFSPGSQGELPDAVKGTESSENEAYETQ